MTLKFAIMTVMEITFVIILLYGLWNENRLIAFEERMEDAIARWLATKIIKRRRRIKSDRKRQNGNIC